jgi:hypothetical protein
MLLLQYGFGLLKGIGLSLSLNRSLFGCTQPGLQVGKIALGCNGPGLSFSAGRARIGQRLIDSVKLAFKLCGSICFSFKALGKVSDLSFELALCLTTTGQQCQHESRCNRQNNGSCMSAKIA